MCSTLCTSRHIVQLGAMPLLMTLAKKVKSDEMIED